MTSLHNINPDGAYDGTQRSLEDFQFDLENMLTMSQLVGKSVEERNASSVMLHPLAGTKNKTAAEVAAEVVTDVSKVSGQKVLYAVLAANTAGRARMTVREDNTKNGAWAWARLRERFGRDSGGTSFTEVFQYGWPSEMPFEDVWRDWVKKVSKHPSGSLSSQAIVQLTISGLSRHGQPELENHLRLRAPLAWQDIQTQVEICLSTFYHQQSPQPMVQNARFVGAKHIRERTVGLPTLCSPLLVFDVLGYCPLSLREMRDVQVSVSVDQESPLTSLWLYQRMRMFAMALGSFPLDVSFSLTDR